jgi:F-type H+-transporting ATPase subunit gamma
MEPGQVALLAAQTQSELAEAAKKRGEGGAAGALDVGQRVLDTVAIIRGDVKDKEGKTVKVLTIGKKGREQLSRDLAGLLTGHVNLSDIKGNDFAESAMSVGMMLTKSYEAGEFDVATLIYSQFRNVISQVPTAQQLIPAKAPEGAPKIDLGGAIYAYEPGESALLEALLPRYINTQILSALLESSAGEQASRMTAMDNATRNAKDLIKALNLKYNRARQAQITKELIEIISGAEAL